MEHGTVLDVKDVPLQRNPFEDVEVPEITEGGHPFWGPQRAVSHSSVPGELSDVTLAVRPARA